MKKHSMKSFLKSLVALVLCLCMSGSAIADVLTLPAEIKVIEKEAFSGDESIDEVVLPEGIERIEEKAFADSSVSKVNLPETLDFIAEDAFDADADIQFSAKDPSYAYNWLEARGYHIEDPASPIEDFIFTYGGGTCQVWKYVGNDTEIVIPDKDEEGNTVTGIYSSAFRQQSNLQSVKIPEGVTSIGTFAFAECSGLKTVKLPESLISIGNSAFMRCSNLENINVPENLNSIGISAFSSCSNLKSFNIPENVSTIGKSAFYYCSSLTSFDIPDIIESIGDFTFTGCSSLTTIEIPNSVENIGEYAFSSCSSLTAIEIPNSVVSIGKSAFFNCNNLEEVNLSEGIETIGSGAFTQCAISSIFLPDSLTDIAYDAFDKESGIAFTANEGSYAQGWIQQWLNQIEFGDYTFVDNLDGTCTLSNYTGNDTVIVIPAMNAEGLTVTQIGNNAFYFNSKLTGITIPQTVNEIGDYAFYNCNALTEVTLPNNLISIGEYAFSNCGSLNVIVIPENTTSISSSAFDGCGAIRNATIGSEGAKALSKAGYSFRVVGNTCSLQYAYVDDEITDLEVVDADQNATSVTVPEGVTRIASYLFYNWNSLTEITLPETLKSIGESAFSGCTQLENINLPESLIIIEENVFYECSSLQSITIPQNLMSLASYTFVGCDAIIYATIGSNGAKTLSKARYSFREKGNTCDLQYKGEELYVIGVDETASNITIPEGVTTIGAELFYGNTNLVSIDLPDSLTTISNSAFYECSSLRNIVIPESTTLIGSGVFQGCSSLETVIFEGSYISIDQNGNCFENTTKVYAPINAQIIASSDTLNKISFTDDTYPDYEFKKQYVNGKEEIILSRINPTVSEFTLIPEYISTIYASAFTDCSSIMRIDVPDNVLFTGSLYNTGCSAKVFASINSKTGRHGGSHFRDPDYPNMELVRGADDGTLTLYHYDGSDAQAIIPSGVNIIGEYSIQGAAFTELVIPNTVHTICYDAIVNCSNLETLEIPDSVKHIGNCAIVSCPNLKTVKTPGIFNGGNACLLSLCDALETIEISGYSKEVNLETLIDDIWYSSRKINIKVPGSVENLNADWRGAGFFNYANCVYCPEGSYTWNAGLLSSFDFTLIPWDGDNPEPLIYGSFTNDTLTVTLGEQVVPAASVYSIGAPIHRITLTISYWNQDGTDNNRYRSNVFEGQDLYSVFLNDPALGDTYVLDTTQRPLNVPGEYTINLWADLEEHGGVKLDSMKVIVEAPESVLSGIVTLESGEPVQGVNVYICDSAGNCVGWVQTNNAGRWMVSGLNANEQYTVQYWHESYQISASEGNYTPGNNLTVTATLPGDQNNDIYFTMALDGNGEELSSGDRVTVGEIIKFTVNVPNTKAVRLVVDGKEYEEYPVVNDVAIVRRAFNKASETARSIRFQIRKVGEYDYSDFTPALELYIITSNDKYLDPVTIEPIPDYSLTDPEPLTISWIALDHAVGYNVYFYREGFGRYFPDNSESALTYTTGTSFTYDDPDFPDLLIGDDWYVEIVAVGEVGWSSSTTESSNFSIIKTRKYAELSVSNTTVGIGDITYFEIASYFDVYDTYKLNCFPDTVTITDNAIVFNAPGTYSVSPEIVKNNQTYIGDPLTIIVSEPSIIEYYGPEHGYAKAGSKIKLGIKYNFTPQDVQVFCESVIVDGTNNHEKQESEFEFEPILPEQSRPVIYTIVAYYNGVAYPSDPITIYAVDEDTEQEGDKYYAIKDTDLLERPNGNVLTTVAHLGTVTLGEYTYGDYREVYYFGQKGFINMNDLEMISEGSLPVLTNDANTTMFITEGETVINYLIQGFEDTKNACITIYYIPAKDLSSDYPATLAKRIKYLETCQRIEEGSIFFKYPLVINEPGCYIATAYLVDGNNHFSPSSNESVNTLCNTCYGIKRYLKNGEKMQVMDSPINRKPKEFVQWDEQLEVVGNVGAWLCINVNNNYRYILNDDTEEYKNKAEKRAYIITAQSIMHITIGVVGFGNARYNINKQMGELLSDYEYYVIDRKSQDVLATGVDVETLKAWLDHIAMTADFNDYTVISIFTHGNHSGLGIDGVGENVFRYHKFAEYLKRIRGNLTYFSFTCGAGGLLDCVDINDDSWEDVDKFVFIGASRKNEQAPENYGTYVFCEELYKRIKGKSSDLTFGEFKELFPEGTAIGNLLHESHTCYWSASDKNIVIK